MCYIVKRRRRKMENKKLNFGKKRKKHTQIDTYINLNGFIIFDLNMR